MHVNIRDVNTPFYCMHVFILSCVSCVALSDLLVSRQISEVADSLPQLWELTLRARDDVKVYMHNIIIVGT